MRSLGQRLEHGYCPQQLIVHGYSQNEKVINAKVNGKVFYDQESSRGELNLVNY